MAAQALKLDVNDIVVPACGPAGLTDGDFDQIKELLNTATTALREDHAKGGLAFLNLPGDDAARDAAKALSLELRNEFDNLIVLGIGGSSLGAKSVFSALAHPLHNLLEIERRPGMRIFFPDNSDPATFGALLDLLELKRTAFAVITKSGGTAETMSQLMVVKQRLKTQISPHAVKRHIVAVTDPTEGSLRKLAKAEGWRTLPVPPAVGGRFSVLTACGTLPAYCAGIDVEQLLAGAGAVANRSFFNGQERLSETPAGALAGILHWMTAKRGRPMVVFMPYADALRDTGDWVVQLVAESLGKPRGDTFVGPTPLRAVGATDQHSLLQLLMQGPQDKTVVFVGVDRPRTDLDIPASFPDEPNAAYLQGHRMSELLNAERVATAAALAKAGRPSITLEMPELTPYQMGALLMTWEIATAAMGQMLGINPFDQPGVELGKRYTGALLKRPGYEDAGRELAARPARSRQLVIE